MGGRQVVVHATAPQRPAPCRRMPSGQQPLWGCSPAQPTKEKWRFDSSQSAPGQPSLTLAVRQVGSQALARREDRHVQAGQGDQRVAAPGSRLGLWTCRCGDG